MLPLASVRRYFWIRRLRRLAKPAPLDEAALKKLSDEHLFAAHNVALRVKRMKEPQLLKIAIFVTTQSAEAAGSFFCAADSQVKDTLGGILREIEAEEYRRREAARPAYRSSAPYASSAPQGARLASSRRY